MSEITWKPNISIMSTPQTSVKQKIVNIGGMGCAGCANTIQEAFKGKEGVIEATVDLNNATASVTYDPDSVSTDDFKKVVEEAGYDFRGIR